MAKRARAELPRGEVRALAAPEKRRVAGLCLSLLGVLSTASMLGVASSLYLVNHHPLLLVGLSPLGRHLILVAPLVDPFAFLAVVVSRRMLFYAACFQLGRTLGADGIVWIEARAARFGRFVRWLERLFERARHVVVFAMAGPTVSVLAGISGMRAAVFAALASLGLALRLVALIGVAAWLRAPIEALLAWIEAWWIPGTAVLVTFLGIRWLRRRGLQRASEPARASRV